ncbi:heme-binding Shp domain-containing protein [Streptococcus equi]|uniref:heme-binding Shp domain-containing protein n=1 Tax=Streptococcus equi TaxID=1336 RepID=UPI001E4542AC|nr:heme-binding Shp domain-containing protein [Streptococcus equi]
MIKRLFKKLMGGLVVLLVCLAAIGGKAYADKGELYSCVIRRDYRHPVSGQLKIAVVSTLLRLAKVWWKEQFIAMVC